MNSNLLGVKDAEKPDVIGSHLISRLCCIHFCVFSRSKVSKVSFCGMNKLTEMLLFVLPFCQGKGEVKQKWICVEADLKG